ncbi:MAG: hypothetical protein ACYDEB_08005 [Dehalococcoidia bacterium]
MPEHDTPHPAEGSDAPVAGDPLPAVGEEARSIPDDGADEADASAPEPRSKRWLLLVGAAVVPAVVVGLAAWFIASSMNGGSGHAGPDVAGVLNAFSSQPNTTTTRFEGALPPGYPASLPQYPGATVVSSLLQVRGADAAYLVVYDTGAAQSTVSKYYQQTLNSGAWQLQGGQSDKNGDLHQFSNIKDPNLSGLVLIAGSNDGKVTTILESLHVIAGAAAAGKHAYAPGPSRPLPAGFPSAISPYPGSTTTVAAYRKQPSGDSYIVTFVTKDAAQKVLDYYRTHLTGSGWTVKDSNTASPPSATPGLPATAITFTDSKSHVSGSITTGTLSEDASYTSVDVQVSVGPASAGGN